jgi:hypothetical protein
MLYAGVFEERRDLLECNVVFFRDGVQEISVVGRDAWAGNLQVRIGASADDARTVQRALHRQRCAHKHPNGHSHTPQCLRSVRARADESEGIAQAAMVESQGASPTKG